MSSARSNAKLALVAVLAGFISTGGGCAAPSKIEATEILNYARCSALKRGISQITFEQLSEVRGVRMLKEPGQPDQAQTQFPADAVLVAVFNGRQPTPGYGFVFANARQSGHAIHLNYTWQTPAPGSMQATVVTSPCSVMQLQPMENDMTVSAWLDDAPLGTLTIQVNDQAGAPEGG